MTGSTSEYGTLVDSEIDEERNSIIYKTYCSRWLMLILFSGLTFTNSFLWISFSSIEVYTGEFFDVSRTAVNFLSVIYMIMYLPGSFFSAYMLSAQGFRKTIVCGALFNLAGAWLRYVSVFLSPASGWLRYAVLFSGQLLCAIGQPFFVNTSAKLAGDWFAASERDLATVVAALVNPIGNAAGQALPPIFVTCEDNSMHSNNSTASTCESSDDIHGMGNLLVMQALVASVTSLAAILLFKRAPPTPPSASASQRNDIIQSRSNNTSPNISDEHALLSEERKDLHWKDALENDSLAQIKRDLLTLVTDKQFQKMIVGFGLGLGIFNALLTMLAQLIQPIYYNSDGVLDKASLSNDAGLYGMLLIGTGLVGAAIFGYLLDVYKSYRLALKSLFTCSALSMVIFFVSIEPNNQVMLGVCSCLVGFFALPLLPVTLQTAVECTYPIPEELSSACLVLFGNIVGIICTFSIQSLLDLEHYRKFSNYNTVFTPSLLFVSCTMFIAWIALISFDGKYKRLEVEAGLN